MKQRYDSLVIGGGMAGLPLALRAARHGTVAFVERDKLGGTCLNRGCIPTKTMIASAAVAHQVRRAAEYGVHTADPTVDLGGVVDRKDQIVESIRSGRSGSYQAIEKADGIDFHQAEGRFIGGRRLAVNGTTIEADRIFLVTGTRTAIPDIDGLDRIPYHTSRTILDLRELPEHLLVVGGGYIGCEFAQMFARFGSQVTLVQRAERLLPAEDPEISAALADGFAADGIAVHTGTTCHAADTAAGQIRIGCTGQVPELSGSHLLIATGRRPNTDQLGLEHLNLQPDPHGFLPVDDQLHTSSDQVWALGDLRGGPMFTHTARDDSDVVYRSVFRGQPARSTAGRVVPHAVFVDPEIAAVGLTEPQARETGHDIVIGRQEFTGVAKARAIGNTRGLVKFVIDATTDQILGCHIAGPDAGNLIHEAIIAMTTGATNSDIARTIHIHPTLAEAVNAAAGGVHRPAG